MRLPRFQLHLSTCIVLMFAAGALLFLNLKSEKRFAFKPHLLVNSVEGATIALSGMRFARSGWPYTMRSTGPLAEWDIGLSNRHLAWGNKMSLRSDPPGPDPVFTLDELRSRAPAVYDELSNCADLGVLEQFGLTRDNHGRPRTDDDMIAPEMYFNYLYLTVNILIALLIMVALAFACEWFLRRRERPAGLRG